MRGREDRLGRVRTEVTLRRQRRTLPRGLCGRGTLPDLAKTPSFSRVAKGRGDPRGPGRNVFGKGVVGTAGQRGPTP